MKKKLSLFLIAGLFLILGWQLIKPSSTTLISGLKVTGAINNQADVEEAITLIQQTLAAATTKDLPAYLDTIVKAAKKETQAEMTTFFADYNLSHELLEIEVLDQQSDRMLLKAIQRTKKIKDLPQKANYRDHLSDANHTLIKEDGQWKISETIMTSTSFLD